MISIDCKTKDSIIKFVEVSGHAENHDTKTIVCSAVSCLIRTVCEIVSRNSCIDSECQAADPGEVVLKVHDFKNNVQDKLSGVTDFLLFGLIGIKRDYPESIKLKINNKEWYDGSQKRWW